MKIKRLFLLGLMAAFAASCVVEQPEAVETEFVGGEEIEATTDGSDPATRTYVDELKVKWAKGDLLSVFPKTTSNSKFILKSGEGETHGVFTKVQGALTGAKISSYVAVYPYGEEVSVNKSEEITLTLPAEQTYAEDSFGPGANTMVAWSETGSMAFKNLGGYLIVQLKGNVAVNSIEVNCGDGIVVAGPATVKEQNVAVLVRSAAPDVLTLTFDEAAKDSVVTLVCPEPVALNEETATAFWIVLPPVALTKDVTFTVNYNDGEVFTQKYTKKDLAIKRSTVLRMDALTIHKPVATLERAWSLLTANGALWTDKLAKDGVPGLSHPDGYGMARGLAMDDDYIYLPKSSAYPAVVAVKRDDPTQIKALKTSPMTQGSTFKSSFARVIKNTDAAVNGGKDILLVCNLTATASDEAQLRLYAYKDGIDNAPVQIAGFCWDSANNVNDWRRYGDRFCVTGTWQSGKVFFPSFNANKTVVLSIANGARTAVQQIWSASSPEGIKDASVYPAGANILLTNTSIANFIAPTGAKQNGWDKFDLVSASEKAVGTFGYNFFTFNEKAYIACARIASESSCLEIYEDQGSEGTFLASIAAQAGLMKAPILETKEYSTLADCAVRVIGEEVWFATMTRDGGLAVDKLFLK